MLSLSLTYPHSKAETINIAEGLRDLIKAITGQITKKEKEN
jgi:hypothetical protein